MEQNLHRYASYGRSDFSDDYLLKVIVGVISAQQQYGAAAGRLRQSRPPNLKLLQCLNSSGLDQLSASADESGCRRYASLIAAYSASRTALRMASRMNSERCRLRAGATRFNALKVTSSS